MQILWARYIPEMQATAIVFQYGLNEGDPMFGGIAVTYEMEIGFPRSVPIYGWYGEAQAQSYEPLDIKMRMKIHDYWSINSPEEFYEQRQWERHHRQIPETKKLGGPT